MGDTLESTEASPLGASSNEVDALESTEASPLAKFSNEVDGEPSEPSSYMSNSKLFQPQIDSKGRLRTHVCKECGKTFLRAGHLTSHMMLHTGERPYHCTYCTKKFTNTSALNSHIRQHTGDKPFQCTECGARFAQTSNLKSHMMHHSGQRPYKCTICDKGFIYSTSLNRHMNCHTGDKPFPCTQCDKKFNTSTHLNMHMVTHTRDRPYACPVCDKTFRHISNLKTHLKVHTKWKGVICSICPMTSAFLTWGDLNDHMEKYHSNCETKEFLCPDCKMCFTDMEEFLSHTTTHEDRCDASTSDSQFPSLSAQLWKSDTAKQVTAKKAKVRRRPEEPGRYKPERHSTKRIPALSELGVPFPIKRKPNDNDETDDSDGDDRDSNAKKSKLEDTNDSDAEESGSDTEEDKLPFTCPVCKLSFPLSIMLIQHMSSHMAAMNPFCNPFQLAMFQAFMNTPVGKQSMAKVPPFPAMPGFPFMPFAPSAANAAGNEDGNLSDGSEQSTPQKANNSDDANAQEKDAADDESGDDNAGETANTPQSDDEDDDEYFTCDLCKLTFLEQDQLVNHMNVHSKNEQEVSNLPPKDEDPDS